LTQNKAKLCKIFIITLVSEKNANFFAENWQKSQKIVIITSTPDFLTSFSRETKMTSDADEYIKSCTPIYICYVQKNNILPWHCWQMYL
jgi:hypothetical protein